MIIEPATPADLDEILTMRQEASDWLAKQGIDQWREPWPDHATQAARITASIAAGETWMTRDPRGHISGTVALDARADPRLWTPAERRELANYLHRLIVRRAWAGLGAQILDWACQRTADQGKTWLRIDVWTHNTPLHDYYQRYGFQPVRTLDLVDYPSGALFQRPARPTDDR